MGSKVRHFLKIPCEYCGKEIATNATARHHEVCTKRAEILASQRLERIKTAPILTLTLEELKDAGREQEFRDFMERGGKKIMKYRFYVLSSGSILFDFTTEELKDENEVTNAFKDYLVTEDVVLLAGDTIHIEEIEE